jgi:ubiquinone biosynthesis protein UbiJ
VGSLRFTSVIGFKAAPVKHSILPLVEQVLNGHVQESSAALDRLASLQGEALSIDIEGMATVVLRAEENRLAVDWLKDGDEPATASVKGTPLSLLMSLRAESLSSLNASGISINGDAEIAEAFSALLAYARPDLEEQLSYIAGDVFAHQLGNVARDLHGWSKRFLSALNQNTSEYLQEESRSLPASVEVEGFFADIERLRDDVERAASRVDRHAAIRG